MCRHKIAILICLTVVQSAAAKNPTALELLDKYAQTQDKIYRSFVIKFEEARDQYNSLTFGIERGNRRGGRREVAPFGREGMNGERLAPGDEGISP